MRLFRMVIHGLWGRKRDTAILGSILFLAFLFLTLSSILLSSFAQTAQLRRQELHGNWQLLYYGAEKTAEEACVAYADVGAIEIVGTTKDNHLIGSVDETVQSIGGLRLVEGRLPQGEDEIVLVQGKMEAEPAVGEEFDTVYQYTYMRGSSKLVNDWENRRNAVVDSLHAGIADQDNFIPWEDLHEQFLTYVREHYGSDSENGNYVRFVLSPSYVSYSDHYDYYLPPGYDLDKMLEENEDELLFEWATDVLYPNSWFDGPWHVSTVRTLPGGLYSYNGFLINVLSEGTETNYSGFAYSEEVKARKTVELQTSKALLYKTYTVVGYVAPYADHWDARGLTLPDGFVSVEAASAQLAALRRAEEDYYEGAPTWEPKEILLLHNPMEQWDAVARNILTVFAQVQKPYFKVEGLDEDVIGQNNQGFIIGLDPQTGEEKMCEIQHYGSVGYFMTDPTTKESCYISGDPRAELRWDEFSSILLPLQPEQLTLEELETNNSHPLRLNQYSYPPSGSTESSLQTLCSGILIGVAACAVFQVFWVQLRRRRMRLVTLMSVGATDGQVFRMLLSEICLLLLVAGVLGTAAGFLISHGMTERMETVYTVDRSHLFGGMALCVAAVLVSAMIPMLLVLRTPLTGREQVSRHTLTLKAPEKHRRQSYARIVLRLMRTNRGRTVLQMTMSFLLAVICLLTVFLCHGAFSGYRRKVEDTAMPDYEIVVPYGVSLRHLRETLEGSTALTENAEISVSREAPNVWLHADALLETSPILKALKAQKRVTLRTLSGGETGMPVRVVGLEDEAMEAFCARLPAGSVDLAALQKGEACVVLVPRFEVADGTPVNREPDQSVLDELRQDEYAGYLLSLHYGPLYTDMTEADESIQVGDELKLTAFTQKIVDEFLKETSRDLTLRVEAVVSTLETPLWPLSESSAAFVLVTGQPAIPNLYPSANTRMTASQAKFHVRMAALFYPDCYGLTRFVINNHAEADPVAMDTAAYDLAETFGVELTNYRLIKEREESTAENRLLLYLLLGIEMALVLSTLLFSAAGMAAEQDRFRFGLLQALGVSNGQVFRGQLFQSLVLALAGCLGANVLLALVQLLAAGLSSRPALTLMENLEGYPWAIHGQVCIGFVLVYTLLNSFPIRRVGRVKPIDNMRS